MQDQAFLQLSAVIVTTLILGGLFRALKQPIMIAYIIAGILVGPSVFGIIQNGEGFSAFSQIGISLLLFMVGLGLNPKHIKEFGKNALIITLFYSIITAVPFFLLGKFFSFNDITSILLALGLSFNSTIVIMKILSDKLALESLPGQLSVGVLILQDLVAMITLMLISATAKGGDLTTAIIFTLLKGLIAIGLLLLFSWKTLPQLVKKIASSQEILLLFSLGWCMAIASIFYLMDFSIEIGALLAGITLSLSPYRYEISAKMRPLRDFFIMLFFVFLGSQLVFDDISTLIIPAIVFTSMVLLFKPIIISVIIGRLGYTKKTSFIAGLNFGQISEFSLIIVALGLKVGQVSHEVLSLLTLVALISITGSTYLMNYSEKIYRKLAPRLDFLEKKGVSLKGKSSFSPAHHDIVLIGYARMGISLVESFQNLHKKFFIVDYNPKIIHDLSQQNIDCLYGDISNMDTLEELNLSQAKMIICTVKDTEANLVLINKVKQINPNCIIMVVAHQSEDALMLYERGANYVIMPFHIGGHHTSTLLAEYGLDLERFLIEKKHHISKLLLRKELES